MLRCAKSLGLKARRITSRWRRLATTPLPAIARRHDGRSRRAFEWPISAISGSQSVQLLSKLVTAATLYFGARLVMQGSLTVGELVAFNMLAARVAQPVLRLAQIWQDFHQARLSIARLGDILNCHPEPSYNPSRSALPAIRGEIAFERVTFRYRVGIPMLETKLERDRPLQEEAESVTQNQQREAEQVAPIVPDDVRFLFEPRPLILHEDPAIMIAWSNR